jgi:HPt (histidine-containing phosphotransfer) domain-containing protein
MTTQTSDPTILDLQILIDIYGDDSAETILAAISGFDHAAKHYVSELQQAFLANDLPAMSYAAHSLNGICGLTGVTHFASLSLQLEKAAKAQQHSVLAQLMSEFSAHWPILQAQLHLILTAYSGANDA